MSQTERILYLDRKIRLDGRVTVAQAAEKFQVSTRQIKRDIEYLRDRFDAPLVYDNGIKAYRYEEKFNDLEFADQNLITSYLALQSITQNHDLMPVYAENMLSAIEQEIPSDYQKLFDKISLCGVKSVKGFVKERRKPLNPGVYVSFKNLNEDEEDLKPHTAIEIGIAGTF